MLMYLSYMLAYRTIHLMEHDGIHNSAANTYETFSWNIRYTLSLSIFRLAQMSREWDAEHLVQYGI